MDHVAQEGLEGVRAGFLEAVTLEKCLKEGQDVKGRRERDTQQGNAGLNKTVEGRMREVMRGPWSVLPKAGLAGPQVPPDASLCFCLSRDW